MIAPLPATRFDAVPAELRDRPQWVAWRYEPRGDKRTKVPVNPATNRNASATDPATWGTFDTALTALDWYPVNGIGFVLSADDPYFMVDLDDAFDIDMLHPWASEIIDRFPDCYCEVSPSGQGIRIIGHGALPSGGNRRGQIELYDRARFSTITGAVYDGMATIGPDCTEALTAFHAALFAPVIAVTTPVQAAPTITFSDDELLARALAAKNGEKLQRILSGDISGYDSASEADAAAAAMLKFWTQDADQIERILRLSSLQRDKWDEHRTYLDTTVKNALALPGETFNAPSNIVDFRTHLNGGSGGGKNNDPPSDDQTVAGFRLSDIGNGQRLAHRINGKAMYCHPAKRWYVYDGQRWNDDALGYLMRWAKDSVLTMYDALSALEDKDRTALLKHALKSESERSLNAAINLARSEDGIPVLPDEFDREPMLLNVENGTIDLTTGQLRPHNPDDHISKLAPVRFDPDATCPRWLAFLEQIFEGDQERIAYLQRVLGYCLTGNTSERAVFIAYGSGRNGKTTLSRLMASIVGDYAKRTPTETIMVSRNQSSIPNDIAALVGARFVMVAETEEGRKLNVSKVKDMAGDEELVGCFKYGEFFTFRPNFKLWISTNHKPVIPGNDQAIFDRFQLIPFTYRVPDGDVDKGLEAKLADEKPGILNWLIQGCQDWQKNGLKPPQNVTDATNQYRSEMDMIGNFVSELCVVGDGYQVTSNALYAAYKEWCKTNSENPISGVWFSRNMTERGFEARRVGKNNVRTLLGLALDGEATGRQMEMATGKNGERTDGRPVATGTSWDFSKNAPREGTLGKYRSPDEIPVANQETTMPDKGEWL